jgi:hypothetical protein
MCHFGDLVIEGRINIHIKLKQLCVTVRLEWKFLFIAYKSSLWYLIICHKYLNIFEALISYKFIITVPYIVVLRHKYIALHFGLAFNFSYLKLVLYCLKTTHRVTVSRKVGKEMENSVWERRATSNYWRENVDKIRNARAFRCNTTKI